MLYYKSERSGLLAGLHILVVSCIDMVDMVVLLQERFHASYTPGHCFLDLLVRIEFRLGDRLIEFILGSVMPFVVAIH